MTSKLGTRPFEVEAQALRSVLPGQWTLLEEQALTGTAASVTFSSIPGDYRTLALVTLARTDRSAENDALMWRANADGGNNYDYGYFYADGGGGQASGATRAASSAMFGRSEAASSRASSFAPTICYWPAYASTSIEKMATTGNCFYMGDVSADADIVLWTFGSRWRSTSAITSLTILPQTGPNFVSGCVFTLYGIL